MIYAKTKGIKISVNPVFTGTQTRHKQIHYLFDYYISIENLSNSTVQLKSRFWMIFDSLHHTEIVEGPGVIGMQPVLKSGERHSYRSHCVLLSNCGAMKGYYSMTNLETDQNFRVTIPLFQLQTDSFLN